MTKIIKLLHTSDIHGYILPKNYANNHKQDIGLSKIATFIKDHSEEETILIDTGDTIQGSPMMHILQTKNEQRIHPIANVMNMMDYDYFIPGNHDFNFGQNYLSKFTSELNAIKLCANIKNDQGELLFQKAYDIYTTTDGIKIAFIGLTTEYIPNWEQPSNIEGLIFNPVITTLKSILKEVQTHHPHAIVVAYHGGFEKDLDTFEFTMKDTKENVGSAIIEQFPEIDVLLTGHQHRFINRTVKDILVSQPGSKGEQVSEITLNFTKTKTWELSEKQIELVSMKNYPSKKQIEQLITLEENITQQYLNQVIGYVKDDSLHIEDQFLARLHKHPIVSLINKIQLQTSDAMISCMSLANDSTGFDQKITIRNVFSTYPFPNTLSVLKILGKQLKEALEENAKYFTLKNDKIIISEEFSYPKEQHYNYDMFDGIEYTIKVSAPIGQRITSLTRNHKPINDEDEFTLVLNNYRASGGGDFAIFKELDVVKEIPNDVPILIIDYIKKMRDIEPIRINNITITK
jgi:2',3'-cyclic-nucleotide 2'-phosphodiesterase/3'-nucleotidase